MDNLIGEMDLPIHKTLGSVKSYEMDQVVKDYLDGEIRRMEGNNVKLNKINLSTFKTSMQDDMEKIFMK